MRPFAFLAAIPLVLGCAQQSALRAPTLPSDEPLLVRLHQPTAGALNYQLSEPAYVAVFAVTRGHGISMVYPHFQSQIDHRSHAGLNQETVHGGNGTWGYSAGARYDHRSLFGHADAYYIVASKYPLPVEGMLQSPYLLRSLIGADVFRATNLSDTWVALESILVAGLPDESWSADVHLNWRDPFMTAAWAPQPFTQFCNGGRSFFEMSWLGTGSCDRRGQNTPITPIAPPIPVAQGPPASPPREPRDRDPAVPMPPRLGPEGIARTSRAAEARPQPQPQRSQPPARRPEARPDAN